MAFSLIQRRRQVSPSREGLAGMHRTLPHAILLLVLAQATTVFATYHPPPDSTWDKLRRGPLDYCIKYLYGLFTGLALAKAFLCAFDKRTEKTDFPRRKPFLCLLGSTAISLSAAYGIGLAEEVKHKEITLPTFDKSVFAATAALMRQLAHCFVYAALLVLLEWRLGRVDVLDGNQSQSVLSLNGPDPGSLEKRPTRVSTRAYRIQSTLFIASMVAAAIARAVLRASMETKLQMRAYEALSHLFLGLYVLTTAFICYTSIRIWRRRPRSESEMSGELKDFDRRVFETVLFILCPIIVFRACYEVIWEAIVFSGTVAEKWTILNLVDIFVVGATYLALLPCCLWVGRLYRGMARRRL